MEQIIPEWVQRIGLRLRDPDDLISEALPYSMELLLRKLEAAEHEKRDEAVLT